MSSTINPLIDAQESPSGKTSLALTLRKLAWGAKALERQPRPKQGHGDVRIRGIGEMSAQTVQWYLSAAKKGDARAQLNLGYLYQHGFGVAKNDHEALKWYRLAVAQGQYNLGVRSAQGRGVPHDYSQTVKWYKLAASHGHTRAQVNLGSMYCKGIGVPKDHSEAVKWYQLAAEQGDSIAQFNLAVGYIKGLGVAQDAIQALMWFSLSAQSGDRQAADSCDRLSLRMTEQQIMEANRLATEWRAAKQPDIGIPAKFA